MSFATSIDRWRLRVASDPDVEYVRTWRGRITHRKGLPGLTLCREYTDSEFAGMGPSTAERYNCKKCKAIQEQFAHEQ